MEEKCGVFGGAKNPDQPTLPMALHRAATDNPQPQPGPSATPRQLHSVSPVVLLFLLSPLHATQAATAAKAPATITTTGLAGGARRATIIPDSPHHVCVCVCVHVYVRVCVCTHAHAHACDCAVISIFHSTHGMGWITYAHAHTPWDRCILHHRQLNFRGEVKKAKEGSGSLNETFHTGGS